MLFIWTKAYFYDIIYKTKVRYLNIIAHFREK